ncbi:HGH1 protein, partial [Callaeas wilsoni]|nr:HGH1 protein [Callaeas wilsoni]
EQLAATKAGRSHLRSRGSYPVLRDLHASEKNPEVLSACEKLIQVSRQFRDGDSQEFREFFSGFPAPPRQVLIGDEPEAGMENLLEVEIPEEVEKRLREMDEEEEEERRRRRKEPEEARR